VQAGKVGKPRSKPQCLSRELEARFVDVWVKACFAFVVNPLLIDVFNGGFSNIKMLLTIESATAMLGMKEASEGGRQQMACKCGPTLEFWTVAREMKYPQLQQLSCRLT
jgi:hypothetical protein